MAESSLNIWRQKMESDVIIHLNKLSSTLKPQIPYYEDSIEGKWKKINKFIYTSVVPLLNTILFYIIFQTKKLTS